MQTAQTVEVQIPLIHVIESDDQYFAEHPKLHWYRLVRDLAWEKLVPVAVQYYEALWRFNRAQADERCERARRRSEPNPETRKQATLRLLLERPTLCKDASIIDEESVERFQVFHLDPSQIMPGRPPVRIAGRAPKCFFAMFKAFAAMPIRGRKPEAEDVYEELTSNPGFARVCGFTLPDVLGRYRQSDVPSLRKLEQFDQIMTANGLWDMAVLRRIRRNLDEGRVRFEACLVHDTTHYLALSSMQTVEIPTDTTNDEEAAPKRTEKQATSDKKRNKPKKAKKKSHPKTTKNCRCADREHCSHSWVSADPGAGTVVKSGGKMHWGHKASTMGFPGQEVLLDAVAMTDAASHDSNSIAPHLQRLVERFPEHMKDVTRLLDDRAADDAQLKQSIWDDFGVQVVAPTNPRGRKPITKNLPKGIDHITPIGRPICRSGHSFDFLGCRHDQGRYLFRAPLNEQHRPVCSTCPLQSGCLRRGSQQRHLSIPFEQLPWLDPELPQFSRRFELLSALRTVIERLHKLMKFDFGDERLSKRGTKAFQARLDKTLLAMHLVIAYF